MGGIWYVTPNDVNTLHAWMIAGFILLTILFDAILHAIHHHLHHREIDARLESEDSGHGHGHGHGGGHGHGADHGHGPSPPPSPPGDGHGGHGDGHDPHGKYGAEKFRIRPAAMTAKLHTNIFDRYKAEMTTLGFLAILVWGCNQAQLYAYVTEQQEALWGTKTGHIFSGSGGSGGSGGSSGSDAGCGSDGSAHRLLAESEEKSSGSGEDSSAGSSAGSSSGSDGVGLIDQCWRGMPHDMNIMLHELEAAHFALFLGMTLYFIVVLITLYIITCAAQFCVARAIRRPRNFSARNSGAPSADAPAPRAAAAGTASRRSQRRRRWRRSGSTRRRGRRRQRRTASTCTASSW